MYTKFSKFTNNKIFIYTYKTMILSDKTIKEEIKNGDLVIDPFKEENIQPSSYDVTLAPKFRIFKNLHEPVVDVKSNNIEELTDITEASKEKGIIVHPGEFILGATEEFIEIPDNLVSRLEGRSSLGRLGLVVHSTAGYIDPGFKGTVTLEISNDSRMPIRLYPGLRVGQLVFSKMTTSAEYPYGHEKLNSKYQGQRDPTASKITKDFK